MNADDDLDDLVDVALVAARRTMMVKTLTDALELEAFGIRAPLCPSCGGAPDPNLGAVMWPRQAVCGADDCRVLVWNPTVSAAANLEGAGVVRLEDPEPGEPATRPRRDDDYGPAAGDL